VQKSPQGGIVKKEALFKYLTFFNWSKTKETTRVGVRVEGEISKIFKKSNQVL
jgi:hypothetical protein